MRNCGRSLVYAFMELKNDYDVVFEAIREDPLALEYASVNL